MYTKEQRQKYTFFAHLLPPAGKNKRFHTRIGYIPSPPHSPAGHAPPSNPLPGLSALFPFHRAEARPKEYRMGYEWGTNGVRRGGVRNFTKTKRVLFFQHKMLSLLPEYPSNRIHMKLPTIKRTVWLLLATALLLPYACEVEEAPESFEGSLLNQEIEAHYAQYLYIKGQRMKNCL